MSDALTPDTPADDPAAEAPESDAAATSGSVDGPDVIPASRFNGLMAKYNADKAAYEAERQALRAEIERLSQAEVETNDVPSDEALAEIRALREQVAAQALRDARREAIAKFPGAAPLADLIVGNTPEEIERMASTLQDRLAGLVPAASDASTDDVPDPEDATTPPADTTPPSVPTIGGAVTVDDVAAVDEDIKAAIANRDFTALMAAKERQAAELSQQGGRLTVG